MAKKQSKVPATLARKVSKVSVKPSTQPSGCPAGPVQSSRSDAANLTLNLLKSKAKELLKKPEKCSLYFTYEFGTVVGTSNLFQARVYFKPRIFIGGVDFFLERSPFQWSEAEARPICDAIVKAFLQKLCNGSTPTSALPPSHAFA